MVSGYTSVCSNPVGIGCSFLSAPFFLFGSRLWVRPDRTPPNRVERESGGLRSATRSTYYTSPSASHFIFEPCPILFGTVSVGGLNSGGSVLRGHRDAPVSRARSGPGLRQLLLVLY